MQVTFLQWVIPWYGMGKTSTESMLNLPGKIGWLTMEITGLTTLLYIMFTLPGKIGIEELPWENWCMAGLFVRFIHSRTCCGLTNPP
jgi:3-oxo-5-alpha-steroid 4-dehydrogenase 1